MTTSSVASLRPAPTMAVYGLASVFLYFVPAIVFLLPTSLVAAELASGWKGGVYNWVATGISKPMGFLAVWCQFAMTIFYYPTLLGFVASTLAYVINPALASNGVWTALVIMVCYWSGVFISSRGTKGVAGLASGGLIIGTLIPGAILILLGAVYLGQGNPSAAPDDCGEPAAPVGGARQPGADREQLPLVQRHGDERGARLIDAQPAKEFPKAMFLAMGLVLLIFILPALAISWIVPADRAVAHGRCDAGLRHGVRDVRMAMADADHRHHARRRVARRHAHLARRAVEGSAADLPPGGLPAPVPAEDEQERHPAEPARDPGRRDDRDRAGLCADPGRLERVLDLLGHHDAGVPDHVPAHVRRSGPAAPAATPTTPADSARRCCSSLCGVGFTASLAALLVGFIPPSQFGGENPIVYFFIVAGGALGLGLLVPFLFYRFRKPSWKQPVAADGDEPTTPDAPEVTPS